MKVKDENSLIYNNARYVAAPTVAPSCEGCAFAQDAEGCIAAKPCLSISRKDAREIIWKREEKAK